MRFCFILLSLILAGHLAGQADTAWIHEQLGRITWQKAYTGVLAEYHKVELILATDKQMVAGTLVHAGETEVHRLIGDWTEGRRFQLQELDGNDRLTGYLRGEVTEDHIDMEWISADQTRTFRISGFPGQLIRIGGFQPVAEWVEVGDESGMQLSIQKMDFGLVSGILIHQGTFLRFDGRCQDGQCSIWNAAVPGPDGRSVKLSMRQRSTTAYTVTFDGREYTGRISYTMPLKLDAFCNRAGFLDFVYPDLPGKAYREWLASLNASFWPEEMERLKTIEREDTGTRLALRTSGWVEILEANDAMVSGLMTLMTPGKTRRAAFVWLRREDELLTNETWLNAPSIGRDISLLALNNGPEQPDDAFGGWLQETGYTHTLPVRYGLLASTDFHILFGDDLNALPASAVREFVKKKYWKYFNWPDK